MKEILNIITPLHTRSKRKYIDRMVDEKVHCMEKAKEYEFDYWDGDRRYGYGGYSYDGRWEVVAKKLIDHYQLPGDANILDIGCGKGFLLYEFKKFLPESIVKGIDISDHALTNAKEEVKEYLIKHSAEETYPFKDKEFDLVFSNTTLHNLPVYDLNIALKEIERVGKNKFICVESFRNNEELFNLQCWALTCESFYSPEEWQWIFNEFGYTGDFEFIYFE